MNKELILPPKPFKPQTKKIWKSQTQDTINTVDYDNQNYDPIYFQEEIDSTSTFQKNAKWNITVEIEIETEKQANKKALDALKLGANSICFVNFHQHKIDNLLKDIQIEIIQLSFKKFYNIEIIVNELEKTAKKRKLKPAQLTGTFYNSSITEKVYKKVSRKLINYQFLQKRIDYKTIKQYNFVDKKHVLFTHTIGNQFLFEIAKLRAFRIDYEYNLGTAPIIECIINTNNTHVNPLIESCVKSISAILGGANAIIIKSNTLNIKQQLILKHESYLNKVSDCLHGSYYVEKITQKLRLTKTESQIKHNKTLKWEAAEDIQLKTKYFKNDLKDVHHLSYGVGQPPFLRGPYLTMYCDKKWTIRQYSGFSTAKESNAFYKKNIAAGQTGLSVAFDLPTHRGYDSDHPRVFGDIGKAGVAVDSLDDIETLFQDIDLNNKSVSMTMNGAIIPIMAFFIANLDNNNIPLSEIRGTIQNDILKEFMVRNTYIYPPKDSMRIVSDIFKYTAKYMPKFNSISVSGYHMLEAGASADLEIAYTLADGLEYVRTGIKAGLKIDDFAPRLSFFWGIGMNFFTEIAKMRAARMLWAEITQSFKPKNPKSMMLRSHCQTSGWSLTAQEPENNITRTTIEAIAAAMGGTQSLHTNALDEAIGLPTEYSAKIARDTQLFLQNETDICKAIDPFGGAYYLEKLTHEIAQKARKHINEIEKAGGMLKAIEKGIPKLKIEASAIKRQTKIDNANNLIIGLNCFKSKQKHKLKILEINNKEVQKIQIDKIKNIRKKRNEKLVQKHLNEITESCKLKNKNLLALAVKAAKEKATLGEISTACEKVFGRHIAKTKIISGIYAMEQKNDEKFKLAQKITEKFKQKTGRRPRILTAKLGQDGHDRGIKIIATSFADIGFDVDISPLFQTPQEIAKQGIENDVHIIGISSLAGGHKVLIPELIDDLKKRGRNDIIIIAGGIIPKKDHIYLRKKGVRKIFGPGTIVIDAAIDILNQLI